jgi:transposase InsO family protein
MGPDIARLYLDNVYRWFGLPKKVISDRDPRFTSHFGHALVKELGIMRNLSTAFHPQTDGLIKQTNQWIEQYLRLLTTNQKDWSRWLSLITIVHNNARNSTLGFTPSTLLVGWEPTLAPQQESPSSNLAASRSVE